MLYKRVNVKQYKWMLYKYFTWFEISEYYFTVYDSQEKVILHILLLQRNLLQEIFL